MLPAELAKAGIVNEAQEVLSLMEELPFSLLNILKLFSGLKEEATSPSELPASIPERARCPKSPSAALHRSLGCA